MSDDQFLLDQITEVEALITKTNTAIGELLTGNHESYELDTGQSRQGVVRLDLAKLKNFLNYLMSERASLRAACGLDRSVVNVIPGY